MNPINPVKLRETQQRALTRVRAAETLKGASNALLWFHEHATEGEGMGPRGVVPSALVGENGFGGRKCPALIVASSTPNVEEAARYLSQAYKELRGDIITRAVVLAQMDLAEAEEAMK